MKLADKPCYSDISIGIIMANGEKQDNYYVGLTFRERLIIALASNSGLVRAEIGVVDSVNMVIGTADAIIKQMEK